VIGERFSRGVLESREDTLIAVGVGAVIGGVIMWFATRKRAQAWRSAAAPNRRSGSTVQGMP
jgi:uncharacterized membrane protein